jgi:acetylornithine deacetylase/succinyl-diaminopimelate desuccinylase family protein
MSNQAMRDAVFAAVDAERDFVIDLTRDMVRIPTVNPKFVADPELNRERELQDLLMVRLEALGCTIDRYDVFPGRPNLIGSLPGNEERSLLLCGHVDVVPEGDRSQWSVDPFGGEVKNGRLWGRGSIDMKSGVAACIGAVHAIQKAGYELDGRVDIHCVVDEEAGGFGAMEAVKRGQLAKAGIVAEPTWGKVMPAEGGLEWVRVVIPGKTAHAGWRYNSIYPQVPGTDRLEPGVNAIELGARFVDAVRELERDWAMRKFHPLLPPGITTINPGVIHGGAGRGADGLATIRTNPAIIPDVCTIDFDLKFLPSESAAEVRAEFEAFVHAFAQQYTWLRMHPPEVIWELGGLHFPPLNTPVDHPIVRTFVDNRAAMGRATEITGFVAVCDAAHYAGTGVPCVIYGASGDGFHGIDEHVEIDSLVETTKLIAAAVIDWCAIRR